MDTQFPPINHPEVARLRRQSAQRKFRKQLRKVRLLWTIAGALLVLLLGEVLIALCCSPRFWIYRIAVDNQETLKDGEVIRLMNLPEHSNYYRVSLGELAQRIEQDPRVERADVQHGAIGTLAVNVRERQAICRLGTSFPPLYMDAAGMVFTRPVPPSVPVPIVVGVSLPPAKGIIGKRASFPQAGDILECLSELQEVSGKGSLEITRLIVTPDSRETGYSLKAILRQGTSILLGQPVFLHEKGICIQHAILDASNKGYSLAQLAYIKVFFVDEKTVEKGGVLAVYRVREKNGQEEAVQQ